MGDIGNCIGKCLNHKGIGSKMDWKVSTYCRLCRKVFPKEEIVNSKFCPCCKGFVRRHMKIKMNELKKEKRLQKVSQQKKS